jgi:hypothetical protein
MEQLRRKYEGRDVEFVSMYVREPHPGETGFRDYEAHKDYAHKMSYARELVELKGLEIPAMVDGIDQHHHEDLGNLPNMAYVVGKDGLVKYRENWLLADEIDRVVSELVTADDPTNPITADTDTTPIGPGI